jgi:hypothetical protein
MDSCLLSPMGDHFQIIAEPDLFYRRNMAGSIVEAYLFLSSKEVFFYRVQSFLSDSTD